MKKDLILIIIILVFAACKSKMKEDVKETNQEDYEGIIAELENSADELLLKWYPLVLDKDDGGYYSEVTHDFKLGERQDKMIVTQARHIWTNARAAEFDSENKSHYLANAKHGVGFLKDRMWDKKHGGFYNLVNKKGHPIVNFGEAKTAYGNAFAIYGLAAYYAVSSDKEALHLAKEAFKWLEEHSHDSEYGGYFQHMETDGTRVVRNKEIPSTSDIGYKDQNSSIHLLEAFTELYKVWPDDLVAKRLEELLILIRDTIVNEDGYMDLFFHRDWTPISFRDQSKYEIKKHYYLDHVSFGHDIETAFLLLEASTALGFKDDSTTLKIARKMVDRSLDTGVDPDKGGIYDGGYYYDDHDEITIVDKRKNWWSQAEGLNTLSFMANKFPLSNYNRDFDELWNYINTYIIDHENGGWYEWGIDKSPKSKKDLKGHIWKATYHNYRSLTNIIARLKKKDLKT